jgi:hypothetical protein
MSQKLIGYYDNSLDSLTDVTITDPMDFDVLIKLGSHWSNLNLKDTILSIFTLNTEVKSSDFVAKSNMIYIVNTKDNPVTALLPAERVVGDRIIFVDAFKPNAEASQCNIGWGSNALTIVAHTNSTLEGEPLHNFTITGDSVHLLYSSCDNWTFMTPAVRAATELIAGIARLATEVEALAGTNDNTIITPLKLLTVLEQWRTDIVDEILPIPGATEDVAGIAKIATGTLVTEGLNDFTIVSPLKLKGRLDTWSPYNFQILNDLTVSNDVRVIGNLTSATGIITDLQVETLNILSAMIFPYNVTFTAVVDVSTASVVGLPQATESLLGIAQIAPQATVNTGLDNEMFVTPLKLANYIRDRIKQATEEIAGIARIATGDETDSGFNDLAYITPYKLAVFFNARIRQATEEIRGIARIATQGEVNTGLDDLAYVTSLKLDTLLDTRFPRASELEIGVTRVATRAEVEGGSNDVDFVTPLKLSYQLTAYVDARLAPVLADLITVHDQLDDHELRIAYLEAMGSVIAVDNHFGINATPGGIVSGTLLGNDLGSQLTVTGLFFEGVAFLVGQTTPVVFGNLTVLANGTFSYTIVNNAATQYFNTLPLLTERELRFQYIIEDPNGLKDIAYLVIRVSQHPNQGPVVSNALPNYIMSEGTSKLEGSASFEINLDSYFSDPEGGVLSYYVAQNTNTSAVYAQVVNANKLRLSFPIWTFNFGNVSQSTITITAVDPKNAQVDAQFDVDVRPLEELFIDEYFEFKSIQVPGNNGYIYATEPEAQSIRDNYSQTYTESTGHNPVFKVIPYANPVPPVALDTETIILISRFRRNDAPPNTVHPVSYIFTGPTETAQIQAQIAGGSSAFIYEGPAFRTFNNIGRQIALNRALYQQVIDVPDPDPDYTEYQYVYFLDGEPQPIPSDYEGEVCEVLFIPETP